MKTSSRAARALALTSACVLGLSMVGGVALADVVQNTVESETNTLTLAADGQVATTALRLQVTGNDGIGGCNLDADNKGYAGGTLTVSLSSSNPTVATVSPSTLTFTDCNTDMPVNVTPVSGGTTTVQVGIVSWTTPTNAFTETADFGVTVVGSNTRPSSPGMPAVSLSPNSGTFSLDWDSSTDAEGDALAYTLFGKDADDTDFEVLASNLPESKHSFIAGDLTEGTWTFLAKAVETRQISPMSSTEGAASAPVVVDKSAPYAPSASPATGSVFTDSSGTEWWKNSVAVNFTDNGDADLLDLSEGSGVASVTPPQSFTTTGSHEASGTVTDNVKHVSSAKTFPVSVDATAPVVSVGTSVQVVKGSTASVAWTASDTGSGLATPSIGTLALDTSSVGPRTLPVPAATDNVGLVSTPVTYAYNVVYDFAGFFQPVDMDGKVNVAKAGSAIPIKFSLGGYQGMDVLAGAPRFTVTGGETGGDTIEEFATASTSSLSYDATTGQYVYVWKTDKAWATKSGTLTVTLADGTTRTAKFSFKK